jgi:adenylate cyclase
MANSGNDNGRGTLSLTEAALIGRIMTTLGLSEAQLDALSEDDLRLLRYVAAVLSAGLPLVAMLQLVRVYGQSLAQVADAEVRLFHLYVHEPLMRSGATGIEVADEMLALSRELLPLSSPVMDQVHQRYLQHFIEQDVVGHMEADLDGQELDLGEVMMVGSDPAALIDWAVGFQRLHAGRPEPRIGIHFGDALYRDGDYYGRDVNIASRVGARAAGGEVLVTRPVVEHGGPHLDFERIAEITLKGFSESTEIFIACQEEEE